MNPTPVRLDPRAFRAHFPGLTRTVHLASCGLGARSTELGEAMTQMLDDMVEADAWSRFEDQVQRARVRVAALIGAAPEQVAVLPNASVGAYQIASTLSWDERPKVLTSSMEFPSIAHNWLAQRSRGAQVRFAETAEDYLCLGDERTALISVPLTTYQYADRLPVTEICARAKQLGALVFVDAYQAAGVEPVNVDSLGCDFLVLGSMKYLLGLPGMAFLYLRRPELIARPPSLTGWFGRVNPFDFDPRSLDFASGARKFETGTTAVPAAYGTNAGLDLIEQVDLMAVRQHVQDLGDLTADALSARGEQVHVSPPQRRGAHVSLLDADPVGLADWLGENGVVVSPRGPAVRIAFHYYTAVDDITELISALARYRRTNPRRAHPLVAHGTVRTPNEERHVHR